MKFSFDRRPAMRLAVDLLAVGVFENEGHRGLDTLNRAIGGLLDRVMQEESFAARADQEIVVHLELEGGPRRVFVVGLGLRAEFDVTDTIDYGIRIAAEAFRRGSALIGVVLPAVDPVAYPRAAHFLAQGMTVGSYRFDRYLSCPAPRVELSEVLVVGDDEAISPDPALDFARGALVAQGVCTARDLVNEPASEMTPEALVERAGQIARAGALEIEVLDARGCEKRGMGLLLAVGRASAHEPRFIHLTYQPKGRERPCRRYALVGKGVTFDSGGLSIKSSAAMEDMKIDMAGAAAVLGAMQVLPFLGVQAQVHALVPAVENMVSSASFRPGDIITGLAGRTVEVVSTDAEGRMVLADALAYAARLQPDEVIDVATLTRGCVVGLGPYTAGIMGNDRGLLERFAAAARRVGESVWQLPLPRQLLKEIKSEVADLKNAGSRRGSALIAGLFLREFIGDTPWIHIDMSGPAYADRTDRHLAKGATGFGVASLVEHIVSRDGLK